MYRVQWYPDIIISEFTPYFDVVGIEIEMLQEDGVDVAADGGVTVTEDTGYAFELRPHAVLDVDRVTLLQLCRREIGCLEIGVIRFALLLAHALLLRLLGSIGCRLLVVEQIVCIGRIGLVLLTALSLLTGLTGMVELMELSGCIIICGLVVDTLDSGASVNSVDLDTVDLFVFIG